MAIDYVQAIETRISWQLWSESKEGRSVSGLPHEPDLQYATQQEAACYFYYNLLAQNSPTYYMDQRFCEMVDHFRKDMPDDLAFDEDFLQSASGWMLLEKPFALPFKINVKPRIKAIGWQTLPDQNAILFAAYCAFKDYDPKRRGFYHGAILPIPLHSKLQERVQEREQFMRSQNVDYLDLNDPAVNAATDVRWIYTAFWLMAQRITATKTETKQRIDRHLKHAHAAFEPVVQVVTLRRMQYENKTSQPRTVDWQWRWIVNAHGRKQYYPATKDHKYILIDSYVKGPQDKPLKTPASKIYVARR